jgi:uncharacterized membrane protein
VTRDSHKRSVVKALSWRATGATLTMFAAYVVTGSLGVATSMGLLDSAVKLFAFYGHERLWNRVPRKAA